MVGPVADHENHLGHLLWELSARINTLAEDDLTEIDLSRPSLGMLDQIATSPGIAIAEIARRLPKTQQAVSQVVARLESLGLVERRLVAGRTIGLFLTKEGTAKRNAGAAVEVAFEKRLEAAFGRATYNKLRAALMAARPILVALQDQERRR